MGKSERPPGGGLSSSAPVVVIHSPTLTANSPAFRATVTRAEAILRSDPRISTVVPPRPGVSISPDRHTALVVAGAADTVTPPRAARELAEGLPDAQLHVIPQAGHWLVKTHTSALLDLVVPWLDRCVEVAA